MRKLLSILILSFSLGSIAQTGNSILKSGKMNLRINADGQLAIYNSEASSEYIEGSGNHLFSFINIWISAFDNADNLYISTVNTYSGKNDYSPGPIDSLTYVGAEPDTFNKIWQISSSNIYEHIKNYKNIGYYPIDAIKTWPANGFGRYNKYLAPYTDYNQNGKYDPENGDYPLIDGDNAAYFILNDNHSEHKASGGQPLKIELYCMLYSYNSLPNTIFAKYFIKNPSNKDFKNVLVSINAGFELGNKNDNYCGTEVNANTVFSYNGDNTDENHFENNKPIAMISILGKNLSSSIYITNDNDSMSGMPSTPQNHRNMMEGKWKNSQNLSFGDNGKGNKTPAKYIFSGNTDPEHQSSNWIENSLPGMRNLLANTYTSELKTKNYITLNFAISGIDNSNMDPYQFVKSKYSEINTFWLSKSLSNNKINHIDNLFIQKNPIEKGENFYSNEYSIFNKITIYNNIGEEVGFINPKHENVLKIETNGLYFIKFNYENQVFIKKIIII